MNDKVILKHVSCLIYSSILKTNWLTKELITKDKSKKMITNLHISAHFFSSPFGCAEKVS